MSYESAVQSQESGVGVSPLITAYCSNQSVKSVLIREIRVYKLCVLCDLFSKFAKNK